MKQRRAKWIKKVVISKHPKILSMIKERYGEKEAEKLTYKQVIKACKKMWKEKADGINEWKIYKGEKKA
jgi:hypothetical protein